MSSFEITYDFDQNLFDNIVSLINRCFHLMYRVEFGYHDKNTLNEFKPCCTKEETELLHDVINKVVKHKPEIYLENIYVAVIFYYYNSIVVEYYAHDLCSLKKLSRELSRISFNVDIKAINELVKEITTSDEEWASYARRKLNNLNFGGRNKRKNKSSKKRKNIRNKSNKKRRSTNKNRK